MIDEEKDVQSESSPDEEVVETGEETARQESTPAEEDQEGQESSIPTDVKEEDEVDERGVPLKNVAMEYKRKYSDTMDQLTELRSSLPAIIQEALSKTATKTDEPKYTMEQLIQYKNNADDPNARAWAELKIEEVRQTNMEARFNKQIAETQRQAKEEQERIQARNTLASKYSAMFTPDKQWNMDHPLTREFAKIYNSRPAFKNDPWGEMAAADIAFANYVYQQQPSLAKKAQKLQRRVKKLEKVTQLEGSGQPTIAPKGDSMKRAYRSLEEKGDKASLKEYTMEYLKKTGRL